MAVSLGKQRCVAGSITRSCPFWVLKQPWSTPAESGMPLAKTVPATTKSAVLITEADASRDCITRRTSPGT
jgi:hypothetical protein